MIEFETMTSLEQAPEVMGMMRALYAEDEADFQGVDHTKFGSTIRTFVSDPSAGRIVLIRCDGGLAGYALIVPYWSNEFGGRLVFVDEIYLRDEYRGKGIGKVFFSRLHTERPYGAVACALETSPKNTRARSLYESIGFSARKNSLLVHYWGE